MPDAFVADVTSSIRRSLFRRLKDHGFTQSELTGIIAGAAKRAVERARVAELADLARRSGSMAAALEAAAPDDPALLAYRDATAGLPDDVAGLVLAP